MDIQQKEKLHPKCIRRDIGFDIYSISGNVSQFSENELIDICDANNWGGAVYMRSDHYAEVKVYTD